MLTISEVAVEYGISRSTVQRFIDAGNLETVPNEKPIKVTKESCFRHFEKSLIVDEEVKKLRSDLDGLTFFVRESVQKKIKELIQSNTEQNDLIQKQQSVIEDLVYRITQLEMGSESLHVSSSAETKTLSYEEEQAALKKQIEGWDD